MCPLFEGCLSGFEIWFFWGRYGWQGWTCPPCCHTHVASQPRGCGLSHHHRRVAQIQGLADCGCPAKLSQCPGEAQSFGTGSAGLGFCQQPHNCLLPASPCAWSGWGGSCSAAGQTPDNVVSRGIISFVPGFSCKRFGVASRCPVTLHAPGKVERLRPWVAITLEQNGWLILAACTSVWTLSCKSFAHCLHFKIYIDFRK